MTTEGASGRDKTIGTRHRGREMALQMLFQTDLGESSADEVIRHFRPSELPDRDVADDDESPVVRSESQASEESLEYARRLVEGTLAHRDEVDGLIERQSRNWRLERMSVVDRNILRLAAYELRFERDVPELVIIDEAIELAKTFGSDESGSFVNGVLDGLLKSDTIARRP